MKLEEDALFVEVNIDPTKNTTIKPTTETPIPMAIDLPHDLFAELIKANFYCRI